MMGELPCDVIERIGECMHTKLDVTRFRAISHRMRLYRRPYKTEVPIKVCLQGTDYILVKSIVYHLVQPASKASCSSSSSMGWIVKVQEVEPENRCLLLHPLSTSLPLKPNSESFPDELNMLEFQVLELAICYSLRNSHSYAPEKKVVMSSDPQWHARLVMDTAKLYYYEQSESVEIQECTLVQNVLLEDQEINQDVIFYKSKFVVVGNYGTTVSIDSSLMVTHITSSLTCRCSTNKLVESLGDLLLVKTCVSHGCKVYKLHEPEKQWVELKSLKKDRSLFVGDCISFSASTQEIPGCLGNHIFFSSDPYLSSDRFGIDQIKLYVRLLMDSTVAVVELTVNENSKVRDLREQLDVADFPLPPHYVFMSRMSIMFEKESLYFHWAHDGDTIDVVPVPQVPQVLQEQEEYSMVMVKIRGSEVCWEANFEESKLICDVFMYSPKYGGDWCPHQVYHELMTSRGPTFTRLVRDRRCYTYPYVRCGDTLQIVQLRREPPIFLKVNVNVDNEEIVVEDVYSKSNVEELRKELEKTKLHLPRQYYFILLVQNAQYLMDEAVPFYHYFIYLEDVKYDQRGMIESCGPINIKVCPYVIINRNKRRRLSYNL